MRVAVQCFPYTKSITGEKKKRGCSPTRTGNVHEHQIQQIMEDDTSNKRMTLKKYQEVNLGSCEHYMDHKCCQLSYHQPSYNHLTVYTLTLSLPTIYSFLSPFIYWLSLTQHTLPSVLQPAISSTYLPRTACLSISMSCPLFIHSQPETSFTSLTYTFPSHFICLSLLHSRICFPLQTHHSLHP